MQKARPQAHAAVADNSADGEKKGADGGVGKAVPHKSAELQVMLFLGLRADGVVPLFVVMACCCCCSCRCRGVLSFLVFAWWRSARVAWRQGQERSRKQRAIKAKGTADQSIHYKYAFRMGFASWHSALQRASGRGSDANPFESWPRSTTNAPPRVSHLAQFRRSPLSPP